jgi:hypothetical protein
MLKESGSDEQLSTKLLIDRIGLERLAQVIQTKPWPAREQTRPRSE